MTDAASGPSPAPVVDLRGDHHVHSSFSDDAVHTPAQNLAAARAAGLTVVRMVDHVRVSTTYVPELVAALAALPQHDDVRVLTGVEAKILDTAGHVDAPPEVLAGLGGAGGVGRVLLADHQLPRPDGPWSPRETRRRMAEGLAAADVVEMLVTATVAALHRVGRGQVAHPFSLLPKIGLSDDDVTDELLDALADAALATGSPVEVNEKWRCPGPRAVARWHARGVRLVASSDAHDSADVGRYRWLRGVPDDEAAPGTQP